MYVLMHEKRDCVFSACNATEGVQFALAAARLRLEVKTKLLVAAAFREPFFSRPGQRLSTLSSSGSPI